MPDTFKCIKQIDKTRHIESANEVHELHSRLEFRDGKYGIRCSAGKIRLNDL